MKRNFFIFILNGLLCYILFSMINQDYSYIFTIPFLAIMSNDDTITKKANFFITILLYFVNPLLSITSLVCYTSFCILHNYSNKYYISITSVILSLATTILFTNFNFNWYYIFIPVTLLLTQVLLTNKNLHYLIFMLISIVFITPFEYYFYLTLLIFFIYLCFNNDEYAMILGFIATAYHFYYTDNYLVILYPLLVYTALYKNYIITGLINITLLIYMIWLKEIDYSIIFAIVIFILLSIKTTKEIKKTDCYPLVLESFNNEIMSFCSFLDNFNSNENSESNNNLSKIMNIVTQTYCVGCSKKYECYGNKKLTTYSMMKKLVISDLQKNKYSIEYGECIYLSDLISKIITLKPLYPVSFNHREEIEVNGLSKALREYSIDLSTRNYMLFDKYNLLEIKLREIGIPPLIFEPKLVEGGIFLKLGYDIKNKNLIDKIYQIAEKVFNVDISVKLSTDNNIYLYYIITNKINFKVTFDEAAMPKNNFMISGDNILAKNYDNGFFKAAIADGMGSGLSAFELSKETINLVDNISKSDILPSTSISILNTFYALNDHYDAYSTLDYLSIDLRNGTGIIYKMGATTTFVVKQHETFPIYNKNLPFGIDKLITTEEITFEDNDLVIMISDGITEHIDEAKLMNYLNEIKEKKVQQIVYDIIQKVYNENNHTIKDDMSVVAIRINNI